MYHFNRNAESLYGSFSGIITDISPTDESCCSQILELHLADGNTVTFHTTVNTVFLDCLQVARGMRITCFYDKTAPAPLVYPPRYHAIVVAKYNTGRMITVDRFDGELISSDRMLQLNLAPSTKILTSNHQVFSCSPAEHVLAVVYTFTTMSIPAQTTPEQVVVLCD